MLFQSVIFYSKNSVKRFWSRCRGPHNPHYIFIIRSGICYTCGNRQHMWPRMKCCWLHTFCWHQFPSSSSLYIMLTCHCCHPTHLLYAPHSGWSATYIPRYIESVGYRWGHTCTCTHTYTHAHTHTHKYPYTQYTLTHVCIIPWVYAMYTYLYMHTGVYSMQVYWLETVMHVFLSTHTHTFIKHGLMFDLLVTESANNVPYPFLHTAYIRHG